MSMIKLEGVSKYYKSEETVSVGMKRVSLEFNFGEFVAITGESGSGKSTLLNVISGLDSYQEGEMYLFGDETSHYTIQDWEKYRADHIGFVFQNYNIIDSFTVLQNVLLALEVQGYDPKTRKQRALELIDKVGLTSHKNHKASKLSGGQKQRTVIARALAKDCPIIVCDEPTGNLDSASGAQVIKLLNEISKDKLIIVVTHDYEQVEPYATRKIKMHDGEVVEDKVLKKTETNIPYTVPKHHRMHPLTLLKFTLRSLFSMPKRLFFLVFMQVIVMIAFTFVFTFRVNQMKDADRAQSERFPNVPETRLLVERRDGLDFTEDDITYFENIRFVEKVYENGLAFYNSYRIFPFRTTDKWNCGAGDCYSSYDYDGMAGTDAASMLNPVNIIGDLPQAANEIVYGHPWYDFEIGDEILIGTTQYYENATEDAFIGKFKIVGIDRSKSEIVYFSDLFIESVSLDDINLNEGARARIINDARYMNIEFDNNYYQAERDENLEGRRINIGLPPYTLIGTETIDVERYFWSFETGKEAQFTMTLNNVEIYMGEEATWQSYMSESIYQEILARVLIDVEHLYRIENRPVVSLSVRGLNNGLKTLDAIDLETYRVMYPANQPSPMGGIGTFFIGLMTGVMVILAGLLLYLIVHAVTKNVMKARKKDFAIFRSIGTSKQTLAQLVLLEQIFIAAISSTIMITAILVASYYIPEIYRSTQYMEISDYVMLVTLFLAFGAWLGLRFNKRIFQQSVIESIVSSREE